MPAIDFSQKLPAEIQEKQQNKGTVDEKLLTLKPDDLHILRQWFEKNPKTDIFQALRIMNVDLNSKVDTAVPLVIEKQQQKQMSSDICAAGNRCQLGRTLATSIHRCPGPHQDFQACNKPIHAICGIEITDDKLNKTTNNSGFHTRWCFQCASNDQVQPAKQPTYDPTSNPRNTYNSATKSSASENSLSETDVPPVQISNTLRSAALKSTSVPNKSVSSGKINFCYKFICVHINLYVFI